MNSSSNFYFELSVNGETTAFEQVEGVNTEPTLKHVLQPGEHPYKYKIPSFPKGQLNLGNGKWQPNSKLQAWCSEAKDQDVPTSKQRVKVCLKDQQGKEWLEWTLHNAYPVSEEVAPAAAKNAPQQLNKLGLAYSFYTLNKKS